MNLVLLFPQDFIAPGQVCLRDYRLTHIQQVHQATVGDQLTVGLLNGDIGTGCILSIEAESLVMDIDLQSPPPQPLPLILIVALPRPKMLKRILQTCATMGVKKLILLNSYRVDKSYWQSPLLRAEAIRQDLYLGLEQAKDTVLPEIIMEKRFKPFVEDSLPQLCVNRLSLVAHPGSNQPCPSGHTKPTLLVIGPEGGFIPYEIEKLTQAGCQPIHIGERILRVETAVPVLLTKLFF